MTKSPVCLWRSQNSVAGRSGNAAPPDLPSAQDLADHSAAVPESLAGPGGKLVQVAEHEGLRDVLITQAFLSLEAVRVLAIPTAGEPCEGGQGAVGIGERLRDGVRGQQ